MTSAPCYFWNQQPLAAALYPAFFTTSTIALLYRKRCFCVGSVVTMRLWCQLSFGAFEFRFGVMRGSPCQPSVPIIASCDAEDSTRIGTSNPAWRFKKACSQNLFKDSKHSLSSIRQEHRVLDTRCGKACDSSFCCPFSPAIKSSRACTKLPHQSRGLLLSAWWLHDSNQEHHLWSCAIRHERLNVTHATKQPRYNA